MKSSINFLVAGVLLSTSAFAAKVGDSATFAGTISNDKATYPAALVIKVTSVAAPGKFVVETTVTVAGQAQVGTSERTADEIGDEARAAQIVANCAAVGGIAEPLTIATGETLATCKVSSLQHGNTSTVNIAAVPFLNAKYVQHKTGITTNLTLQSYTRGQ